MHKFQSHTNMFQSLNLFQRETKYISCQSLKRVMLNKIIFRLGTSRTPLSKTIATSLCTGCVYLYDNQSWDWRSCPAGEESLGPSRSAPSLVPWWQSRRRDGSRSVEEHLKQKPSHLIPGHCLQLMHQRPSHWDLVSSSKRPCLRIALK